MSRPTLPIKEGDRFGRLVAIRRETNITTGPRCWIFACDCGREYVASVTSVFRGKRSSCGCLAREREEERLRLMAEGRARRDELRPNRRGRRSYVLVAPDGQEHNIQNLQAFCESNGLNASMMRNVMRGLNTNHKGWTGRYDGPTTGKRGTRSTIDGDAHHGPTSKRLISFAETWQDHRSTARHVGSP
jgi:hypothetical protein